MQHHLSKSEPLSLSEIQFIEEFINKNMSSSVPKRYIKSSNLMLALFDYCE
jgi:hypothetical protein